MLNYLTEAIFLQGAHYVKGTSGGANGQTEYLCIPKDPNALLTDSVWMVLKYVYDSTGFQTATLVAEGKSDFIHRADNPASLTYPDFT